MASITLTTTDQTILDDLDEMTALYEGTLPERIKAYTLMLLKGSIRSHRDTKAKAAVEIQEVTDEIT